MIKNLINKIGGKWIYFIESIEDREGGYYVCVGELSFNYKGEMKTDNILYHTDNARDLYDYLMTGEKKNEK